MGQPIINPLALAQADVVGVEDIAAGNIVISTGRCNRNDPAFQKAREKGAEVYPYINYVEAATSKVCSLDDEFYMGSAATCPRWPYPSPGERWIWQPSHTLTDIRASEGGGCKAVSSWPAYALDYLSDMMASGLFDGVFLDVIGGRLWGQSNWESWPEWEQQEWQAGVRYFISELDARRRAINRGFKIVNNNTWQYLEDCAGYVDGIMLEHINPENTYTVGWASQEFGDLGQRRVLILAREGETAFWKTVPGVTHIGETPDGYGSVAKPTVPYMNVQNQDIEALKRDADARLARLAPLLIAPELAEIRKLCERERVLARVENAPCRQARARHYPPAPAAPPSPPPIMGGVK